MCGADQFLEPGAGHFRVVLASGGFGVPSGWWSYPLSRFLPVETEIEASKGPNPVPNFSGTTEVALVCFLEVLPGPVQAEGA